MSGPRLEILDQSWSAAEFTAEVENRMSWLRSRISDQAVWMFPAATAPESVWTLHALHRLGAVALPVPPVCSPTLQVAYTEAACMPVSEGTQLRLLTSGSTGTPAVVDLTTTQLQASVVASQGRLGCSASDRWLCCLPLNHIAGISILLRTAHAGATAVLQTDFDPGAVNFAIDDRGITMISLVPSMLRRVLDDRADRPFPQSLRVILLGGAPASDALISRCRAISAPVSLTWGMTETGSQIATRAPGDLRLDPDVGLPLPGHEVSVTDGRLVVRGPIAPGGCFVTGDCGHLDDQGRVVVNGRGHRLIISGGENVDPFYVESILRKHPSIEEAAVIGVDDAQWGQRAEAFLVGDASADVDIYLRKELGPHERPKRLHWVNALPRTQLGKIDRGVLTRSLAD